MRKLLPLIFTSVIAVGLASCDITGEESFSFEQGESLAIVGPSEIALDSTGSYYTRGFTIDKDYTWTVNGAEVESYRDGEYIDLTPDQLGPHTITVEDPEYSGQLVVDVTDFIPGEAADQGFTLFQEAIQEAALVDTLQGEGPFTALAPTNDAMLAAFDADENGSIDAGEYPSEDDILYHILPSEAASTSLEGDFVTIEGSTVSFTVNEEDETITVNDNATVVATDSSATNGVIHGIDAVLTPPTP